MALWIQISPGSDQPIYGQIVNQVSRAIAGGEVAPGDKLPPVRKLAAELVINPNTVARAYSLLESRGLVSSKTGSGTFVTGPAVGGADAGQLNILSERMDNIITQAINVGLTADQIKGMLSARLRQFAGRTDERKSGQ